MGGNPYNCIFYFACVFNFAGIKIKLLKEHHHHQSLVGLVVIGVGLGRENHVSISYNCNREGAWPTWYQSWSPKPDYIGGDKPKKRKPPPTRWYTSTNDNPEWGKS